MGFGLVGAGSLTMPAASVRLVDLRSYREAKTLELDCYALVGVSNDTTFGLTDADRFAYGRSNAYFESRAAQRKV